MSAYALFFEASRFYPPFKWMAESLQKRLSGGPQNSDKFSTVDLAAKGDEASGFRVKWTWVPPASNPNMPMFSLDIMSTAYSSVSVIEGSSPPVGNNGDPPGATAVVGSTPYSTAVTYGNGLVTYDGTPGSLTETVNANGKKTC